MSVEEKKLLGITAVEEYVSSDMSIGLGSGSTAIWAVRHLAAKYKEGAITGILCVSTGPGTAREALSLGLPMQSLNTPSLLHLDVVIDGADFYDDRGVLVKGGGGCLLQEKLVAYSASQFVVLVTKEKRTADITLCDFIPIEIVSSALTRVEYALQKRYDIQSLTLRMDAKHIGPWITEGGNYVLDMKLQKGYDPFVLEQEIVQIVGVVEIGIFTQKPPILKVLDGEKSIETIKCS